MRRQIGKLLLAMGATGMGLGAAPRSQTEALPPPNAAKATPSYHSVTRAIAEATGPWDAPGAVAPEAAVGWRTFFDALKGEMATYGAATTEDDRLRSLTRIRNMNVALGSSGWAPAARVRSALGEWLAPRVRLAWAERRLVEYARVNGVASAASADHARLWEKFVGDDLGSALAAYEGARTVQARRSGLRRMGKVLAALRQANRAVAWPYAYELQAAAESLFSLPNLDVSADVYSVSPFLANDVVTSGPIARDGYVSQVTAGPRTGFGLLPSDEGIVFYNSQLASTVTPITDFQQQLQQDKKGRKVSKLYYFSAQSFDTPNLTITAILRPSSGLSLSPAYAHSIGASFGAAPIAGKGLARGLLSILGLNRDKLTQKVAQQAIPKIAKGVVEGANAEAAERIPVAEAQQNAKLHRVFIGNNTLAIQDFRITGVTMQSRPTNVLVGGTVFHKDFPNALGADMPQPPSLAIPAGGVSADVHLASILTNVVSGLLESPQVRGVENLMVVTRATQPGAAPKEGVTVGRNVDFPTYLKQIAEARAANNPQVTALRFKKPGVPPEFAADERGNLVILVRDFQLDVPAPPGAERGGFTGPKARVYRFLVPTAEFVLSFNVPPRQANGVLEFDAKVVDFVPSADSRVQAILDDENAATPLQPFIANIALGQFRTKLQQVPIKAPLTNLNVPGFDIAQVAPLDPSGWMRVVLMPNGQPVKAGNQAAQTASYPVATPTASVQPSYPVATPSAYVQPIVAR